MLRNQWPDKIGMGDRILLEQVAGSLRNTQTVQETEVVRFV